MEKKHDERTNHADLKNRIAVMYQHANDLSAGTLDIVRDAFESFSEARGSEAAAGIAYYAMFSLFPLLLALVAAGSFVLEQEQAFRQTVSLMTEAFPVSQEFIEENIRQVLGLRGPVGLIGLAGALWSGSGVFTILTRNINRAWSEAEPRGFLKRRLVALGMVGTLIFLLIISLLSTTTVKVLARFDVPLWGDVSMYGTPLWTLLSNLIPWLFTFLLFMALYRWVPNVEVTWSASFWAACVVAIAWEIAANTFAWYVGSGLARYKIVYGSLGTVVALMFWIYVSSWIVIFGAHLSAVVAHHT